MSAPEVILWSRLRPLRERGFHIRRQVPFRGYFLDFACLARRLVIEVDGGQHNDDRQSEHDHIRDRILARQGFKVLRFSAGEVRRNAGGVMDQVVAALEAQPHTRRGMGQTADPESGRGLPTMAASRPFPPH